MLTVAIRAIWGLRLILDIGLPMPALEITL
jgi:hypothetical protein